MILILAKFCALEVLFYLIKNKKLLEGLVKNNKLVKGLKICDPHFIYFTYADGTTFFKQKKSLL